MNGRLFKFDSPHPETADLYGDPWEAGAAMWQLERVFTIGGRQPTPADLRGLSVGECIRLTDETGDDSTTLTRIA